MEALEKAVRVYIQTWNDADASHRRATIENLYTEDCAYTDPMAAVEGRASVDAMIAAVQKQLPGLVFSIAGKIDVHHAQARFQWQAAPVSASEPVIVGFDVVAFEGDRIRRVYGFLDKVPG